MRAIELSEMDERKGRRFTFIEWFRAFCLACILFAAIFLSGCVTSPESVSIRRQLVDTASADMASAAAEVAGYFKIDIEREAQGAYSKLEEQFRIAVEKLQIIKPVDATPEIVAALAQYNRQRARIEGELIERARRQSLILAKLGAGPLALDAIEQSLVLQESEQRRVLDESVAAIFGLAVESGRVDPALLESIRNVFATGGN